MNRLTRIFYALLALLLAGPALATPFEISSATIVYAPGQPLDSISAHLLANDIKLVTGRRPPVYTELLKAHGNVIIIGKYDSKLVRGLGIKDLGQLAGKWECYSLRLVNNMLVIAGSDARGTAYGVFAVSEKIGVSPWYWWADVKPEVKPDLSIDITPFNSAPPSVQYRGIFLNDEDWGLQPWAAKTFEPEVGNIGPKTYAKIFELLLRLKANLIWPAMHPGTAPFFTVPGNKQTAAAYQIIVGTSHAEPMLRNNVGEWKEASMGKFNYLTNKQEVLDYWMQRVQASVGVPAVYTLGMRGVHDSGMEGIKDAKDAVPLLEQIFTDQRGLLKKYVSGDVRKVPQAFTAYKEVLDIYDKGLQVPADVTIVWPDDNYGYIQRLNDEPEKKRPGGSGVYYHVSYWGRPHDYLWLGSTHPGLVRSEMMKAWETKSNKLWVVNVGDIKPLEYLTQFFLDMAYNVEPFKDSRYTQEHLSNWLAGIFGKQAGSIQPLLWKYYQLAFERRPEFMGWSQTEPTTRTSYTTYNHFSYGDEALRRLMAYDSLENTVKELRNSIDAKDADAFYELVHYPIVCASWMNKKFLFRDKAYLYGKQSRIGAENYGILSKHAYSDIQKETDYYNNKLADGKWRHMMSMEPRALPVFSEPVIAVAQADLATMLRGWKVIPEGMADTSAADSSRRLHLPVFDNVNRQKYFVDIIQTGPVYVDWSARVSADWIRVSKISGGLTMFNSQDRVWVDIDWTKAPKEKQLGGEITFMAEGKKMSITVNAKSFELPEYAGYVENNGVISMRAANFDSNTRWKYLEDLRMMQSPGDSGVYMAYTFYSFTDAAPVVNVFALPTHPVNKSYGMRYGVSIDDGPVTVVDFRTVGRSEEWKQNVLRNSAVRKVPLQKIGSGRHVLKIYSIDPGVILDRIEIDLGGLQPHYGAIPETIRK